MAACGGAAPSDPVEITVIPDELQGFAIAGQRVVFLATDAGVGGPAPLLISAEADGAEVKVEGGELAEPGAVAEVSVVPDSTSVGREVKVTITGARTDASHSEARSFEVIDGVDDREQSASLLRDRFVGWLAADRPDLGITADTQWHGTMVSPQWLVVSHYLYFSAEWEMHVSWHIMIAPEDWARVDLRPRFRSVSPTLAYEIPSVSEGDLPRPAPVPESVWR